MDGSRIREMREALGLTQEQLAEIIDVGVLQINRYENNKTQPNADMLIRLAQGLGCSADYLLGLIDDPRTRNPSDRGDLNVKERVAISAWRRGERIEAIKMIAEDDK